MFDIWKKNLINYFNNYGNEITLTMQYINWPWGVGFK